MYIPPGFGTVTPYLFADDADRLVRFVSDAFGAEESLRSVRPDGKIAHAQLRIGNSTLMLSESKPPQYPAMPASFYLYVDDADASMRRALEWGAVHVMDVQDMPYGDRQGGVRDPAGNLWWISQRLVQEPYSAQD